MNTLPRTFLRTLTFGAILGTLASISSVSMADDASAPSPVVVSFADLDLSHGAGVVQLYGRLKGAAETACGALTDGGSGGNLTARAAYRPAGRAPSPRRWPRSMSRHCPLSSRPGRACRRPCWWPR